MPWIIGGIRRSTIRIQIETFEEGDPSVFICGSSSSVSDRGREHNIDPCSSVSICGSLFDHGSRQRGMNSIRVHRVHPWFFLQPTDRVLEKWDPSVFIRVHLWFSLRPGIANEKNGIHLCSFVSICGSLFDQGSPMRKMGSICVHSCPSVVLSSTIDLDRETWTPSVLIHVHPWVAYCQSKGAAFAAPLLFILKVLVSMDAKLLLQVLQVSTELFVCLLQVVHRAACMQHGRVVLATAVCANVRQ
jgi:hypothetical protein